MCMKIVVWGDSIAAQGELTWPTMMQLYFDVAVHPNCRVEVINEASCGMPAATAVGQYEDRIAIHQADFVVIQFGFNDLRYDGSRPGLPISTEDEFYSHLSLMLEKCHASNAKVLFVANHQPFSVVKMPNGISYCQTVEAYNAKMEELASVSHISYLDMSKELASAGLNKRECVVADGVHLSETGIYAYAQIITNYFSEQVRDK